MFRVLRKGILIYILILVAVGDWMIQNRLASWENTLWVGIYPINGDGSEVSRRYIAALDQEDFDRTAAYIKEQAGRYGITLRETVKFVMIPEIAEQPPLPPRSGNMLQVMWWSLNLRWWAWQREDSSTPPVDAQIFVRYFDPGQYSRLQHSLGLQKGRIGIVNAFAGRRQTGSNHVVIAHELLHTLGATDKYDPATTGPLFPDGYAEPGLNPRHPQRWAELMGGRIPITATEFEIPRKVSDTVIGPLTAQEIGWQ